MSASSTKTPSRLAKVKVRLATKADVPAIQKIYAHYVRSTTASFEEEPPTVAEMTARWHRVQTLSLPYLVAMKGKKMVGYAYAGPFRERSGYRYTIEDSVYVAPDYLGRNVGNSLLSELIKRCTDIGFRQMIAVLGDGSNAASVALHRRHGFSIVGALGSTCFKFGRWVDAVLMQRILGEGDTTLPPKLPGKRKRARAHK
jgi:L-amino acid N-acyltransferase YncA